MRRPDPNRPEERGAALLTVLLLVAVMAVVAATALERVWKAQNFSYWATHLMHTQPGENPFNQKRRRGEFKAITGSERGAAYFAESYTGWPDDR